MLSRLKVPAALACAAVLAGCGGGGEDSVAQLGINVTRVGVQAVQIDWTDDPYVVVFQVRRNGFALADVDALSLVDASVVIGGRYCYDVAGYDRAGYLTAATDAVCISVF